MTTTRKMAYIAVLSALSFVLLFMNFPLLLSAPFLKVDFSIIPILLALVVFDLKAAYSVLVFRTLLKFLLNFEGVNTWVGMPMNVIAIGLFVAVFALIWKKKQTLIRFITAALVATLTLTVAMAVLNMVYAVPLYVRFAGYDPSYLTFSSYIILVVLPFNLIQGAIFSVAFYGFYAVLKPALKFA